MTVQAQKGLFISEAEAKALVTTYNEEGFVFIKGLLSRDAAHSVKSAFYKEIKPSKRKFYRQNNSRLEQHNYNEQGFVMNPLKHVIDYSEKTFFDFKHSVISIFDDNKLQDTLALLLSERPTLVQTLLFEGNPVTPAHNDSYYVDSTNRGTLLGVWVALEDIAPEAGGFYVCPKSHKMEWPHYEAPYDDHDVYLAEIKKMMNEKSLEIFSPHFEAGDALIWNANLIHGSLETVNPSSSRLSLIGQFIPSATELILFEKVLKPLQIKHYNNLRTHCPTDETIFVNRLKMMLLEYFPEMADQYRTVMRKFSLPY